MFAGWLAGRQAGRQAELTCAEQDCLYLCELQDKEREKKAFACQVKQKGKKNTVYNSAVRAAD